MSDRIARPIIPGDKRALNKSIVGNAGPRPGIEMP